MLAYLLAIVHACPFSLPAIPDPSSSEICERVEQANSNWSFGSKQVEQFMIDRPDAAKILRQHPTLRLMLVYYFAGRLAGERIYWDEFQPRNGNISNHLPSISDYPAHIRVSKKHDRR